MSSLAATMDRINTRATQVDWRKVLLVALMALPFVVGYSVRLVVRTLGWVAAWVWAAAVEGYQAGARHGSP